MKELLFSFDGRINRTGFWKGVGIAIAMSVVLNYLASLLPVAGIASSIVSLFVFYILFAVTAKRYHDQDKSGWWSVCWLVPVVGWLYIIIECGTGQGYLRKNQYGDPVTSE